MGVFIYPELDTERLVLRPLTLADGEEVFRHFADADVVRFMDIEPCGSLDDALEIIQFHLDDSGCRWGLFDKAAGRLAGTCGYHCWSQEPVAKAEIGYDLSAAYWGQGLMKEALAAVIGFGFERMGLGMIEATVEPENARSLRVLEGLGFQRREELVGGLVYYSLMAPGRIGGRGQQ
ncbi:GNAT family N-acetyltransferase ['Paenibacillus yunnanensis' Narsing Rao et al. 2020]|uniref:GNAT family N-acetyltransferase n=1 Tax=Paenibacillus tengchongensis TaxID=2608684 RepID=UPI00124F7084|nr:GNAT family N-acetyltransferase [Paenibacillus tengchongensis]